MTEQDKPQLDPLTELSVELQRPIPTGTEFVDWLVDDNGLPEFTRVLLDREFTWPEIAMAVFDLSHGQWAPSEAFLQALTNQQAA